MNIVESYPFFKLFFVVLVSFRNKQKVVILLARLEEVPSAISLLRNMWFRTPPHFSNKEQQLLANSYQRRLTRSGGKNFWSLPSPDMNPLIFFIEVTRKNFSLRMQ